jgi:hypothetical protein
MGDSPGTRSSGHDNTTELAPKEARSENLQRPKDLEIQEEKASLGWKFWIIFIALAIASLLTAIESTVTSTALPTISRDLDAGEVYVWFVNAFFLTR